MEEKEEIDQISQNNNNANDVAMDIPEEFEVENIDNVQIIKVNKDFSQQINNMS